MTTYTIDETLNITAYESAAHMPESVRRFASEDELAGLTAPLPLSTLADTWNSFAGVTPSEPAQIRCDGLGSGSSRRKPSKSIRNRAEGFPVRDAICD